MMTAIDYENAMAGVSMGQLARYASSISRKAAGSPGRAELLDIANAGQALSSVLKVRARENVDVASRAGALPTNYLGVDSVGQLAGGILAGTTLVVNSAPNVMVRPTGFRFDDTFSADFSITEITVSNRNLIIGAQACPSSMFTTGIALPPVQAPRASGGSVVNIGMQNIGGAARRGRAGLPVLDIENAACQ
jgi:hypothetical protein